MYTQENTTGYTDAELAELNQELADILAYECARNDQILLTPEQEAELTTQHADAVARR